LLLSLFGVLFFLSAQCFAPSDTVTTTLRQTATPAPAQGGADPTRTLSSDDGGAATPTAQQNATAAATLTPVPPTATPVPPTAIPAAPTSTAVPGAPAPVAPPPAAAATANFAANWRIIDTVTEGSGAGQTFTFDVTLTQTGNEIGGGNGGIVMTGSVSGTTASVSYTQPALGLTGTFIWTMGANGNATGTFTSSVPNSGTSQLIRR
jgi:hypothetical protein